MTPGARPARPPEASGRVLSTLNRDGTRAVIRPRLSPGGWWTRRRVLAWALMAVFVLLPIVRVGGEPGILLDVAHRRFVLLGAVFSPTELSLLMLFMVGVLVSVVLLTAIVGRAWCGWACPQTVYLEFLFRPLERLVEGPPSEQRRLDRTGWTSRRVLKNALFVIVGTLLGHAFLAYFVGWSALLTWMRQSPTEHPGPFLVMAAVAALVTADFAWFREQTCIVACPYGRFQSVLLDRDSLIVGYDARRGEPRGMPRKAPARGTPGVALVGSTGDCIDCGACVNTCPTGIDIREGLQMECVGCTQCIDACDAIMDRVGRPRGLIRYTSQGALEGQSLRLLRPRLVIYPVVLLAAFGLLGWRLAARPSASVVVLRRSDPFTELADGRVSDMVSLKVTNRASDARDYTIVLTRPPSAELIAPENPVHLAAGEDRTAVVFVNCKRAEFTDGKATATFTISDGRGFVATVDYPLLGPS